jgi:uncharacterized protein YjaG (DUF416 family)
MQILQYDEVEIVQKLWQLPVRLRALFALLCALRVLPSYARFHSKTGRGDPLALEALSERLWQDLTGNTMAASELQLAVDSALRLVPAEDDGWDEETQPYAEDAAAALAYALRARVTGDPQEAAWSARRVYEAADHFALGNAGEAPSSPTDERRALSHAVVQGELARQQRDLRELAEVAAAQTGADARLDELRKRSQQEAAKFFCVST